MNITCPVCHYDRNPDGNKFCEACGSELTPSKKTSLDSTDTNSDDTIKNIYPPEEITFTSRETDKYPDKTMTSEQITPPPPSTTTAKLIPKQAGATIPEFILDERNSIIGRFDPDTGPVEVDLEGFPGDETVSRHHGEIYLEGGQWKIKDLGSTNHIFIKRSGQTSFGAKITMPETLNSGDEIAIGKIRLLFQTP